MADWRIRYNGKEIGPVGDAKLKELARSGRISRDCEVQQVGSEKWYPITKIKGLYPSETPSELVPTKPVSPQPIQQYQPAPAQPLLQPIVVSHAPAPVIHVHQSVVTNIHGRRWSRVLAGLLSFVIPGLGQLYKGQPINGFIWFVLTLIGYVCFIIPGLVLHFLCILGAMSGDTSK